MENVCRLCGSVKPPDELIYNIEDSYFNFEQKLIDCCRWKLFDSYEYGSLPRQFCDDCFQRLENSWEFAECVAQAQEQFLLHMVELKPAVLIDVDNIQETSLLNLDQQNNNNAQIDTIFQQNEVNFDVKDIKISSSPLESHLHVQNAYTIQMSDDDEHELVLADDKKTIFKETLPESIHKNLNFLELLSECDKNADGTVNPDKLSLLNLDNWSIVQSKCFVCSGTYSNERSLITHFQQYHPNETLKYLCTICNSLFAKKRGLFRHVTNMHRPYLQFWFVIFMTFNRCAFRFVFGIFFLLHFCIA